jgi:hypothetical protein
MGYRIIEDASSVETPRSRYQSWTEIKSEEVHRSEPLTEIGNKGTQGKQSIVKEVDNTRRPDMIPKLKIKTASIKKQGSQPLTPGT